MLRISHYDSPRGSGWDLATGLPAQPDQFDHYLGKPMFEGDGVRRCLYCHTTNFRAVLDQVGPEAADHSIGCERCHGPGGHHVAAVAAGFSDPAIANPGAGTAAEINQLCGQCHNIHRPDVLDKDRTDPVWYRFQALTLTWSRCYTESQGTLSCVSCHDPHRLAETSAARQEVHCLSCHGPEPGTAQAARASHSDPTPASTASRTTCPVNPAKGCIDCHMARAWEKSTHTFKTDHFIRVRERDRLPAAE